MSVSQEYRQVEDGIGRAFMLHETLLQEISYKMTGAERVALEGAIYRASVACGHPVLTIAYVVNEFLAAYQEHGREEDDGAHQMATGDAGGESSP